MRISKCVKSVSYLAVLVAVNLLLSFLLEPAGGASSRMWSGYYAESQLDMIFVGSSVCQQTIIPDIFNKKLGVSAYNMGTPSQAMSQTIRAVEVAMQEHEIKTVVFAMGFSSLKYEPLEKAEITFESARTSEKGGVKGILDTLFYIYSEDVRADEKSVNFLFPWLYNSVGFSWEAVTNNVDEKLERIDMYLETGEYDKTDGLDKGFRNDDKSIFEKSERWENNTDCYYEAEFNAEMLSEFESLLVLCERNDVDLIILNTPHPAYDVVACYEYYEANQEQVKEFCVKYNADYYDFSLVKPEIFENANEYFGDFEHLNRQGAYAFCESFSDFLMRRANGEDVKEYFYSVGEFMDIHAGLLAEWQENR